MTGSQSTLHHELSEENFKKAWAKINKGNIKTLEDLTREGGPMQEFFKKATSSFFRGLRGSMVELVTLLTDNFTPVGT